MPESAPITTRFPPFHHVRLVSLVAHCPGTTAGMLERLWELLSKARPTPQEAQAMGYQETLGPDGRAVYRWRLDAATPIERRWTADEARLLAALVRNPPEAVPWLAGQVGVRNDMLAQLERTA